MLLVHFHKKTCTRRCRIIFGRELPVSCPAGSKSMKSFIRLLYDLDDNCRVCPLYVHRVRT